MNAVTFCTKEYARFIEPWSEACEAHGLNPHVIRRKSLGCYDRNTNQKPIAIMEACERVGAFVYFDIDCIPTAPFDFALPKDIGTVKSVHPHHRCKIASSLLFVGHGGALFIKKWAKLCERNPTRRDHPLLVQALHTQRGRFNIRDMTRYCAGRWSFNALNPDKITFES
jgi:hypothetical protein